MSEYDDAIKRKYLEMKKYSDESINNLRKNASADLKYTNKKYSDSLPIDEFATMGSDTQGVVRDYRKISPELAEKWSQEQKISTDKIRASEAHLHERGYEKYKTKITDKNPISQTAYKHKLLGKTLKGLGIVGAIGAGLASSDASAAVADVVVPGGVESVSDPKDHEIKAMQRKAYEEALLNRAKNNK